MVSVLKAIEEACDESLRRQTELEALKKDLSEQEEVASKQKELLEAAERELDGPKKEAERLQSEPGRPNTVPKPGPEKEPGLGSGQ